jgi:hypothetical protein
LPLQPPATLSCANLTSTLRFLYTLIKEDVYIHQPLGFIDGTSKVCHLTRCLYGLKSLLASSTCCSVHGSSTTGDNNASPTRASTSSAPVTCSP